MKNAIKNLFENYLCAKGMHINKCYITTNLYNLCKYHRIDPLLWDDIQSFDLLSDTEKKEAVYKKQETIQINSRYINEIIELSTLFEKEGIKYVFLKGGALTLTDYHEIYHRCFSDIDILINFESISSVVKILNHLGYVQGEIVDNKIVPASRAAILYQQLHTHEIYSMVKLTDAGHAVYVDVNFLFSWNGIDKDSKRFSLEHFSSHRQPFTINNTNVYTFDADAQFVHLCSHFYNEAMFFSLDQEYISGEDPQEIRLFRLLDILLVSSKINIEIVYKLASETDCVEKIEYVISLIQLLMGEEYVEPFKRYFKFPNEFPNHFYIKDGTKIEWPIKIDDRLFNPFLKQQVVDRLCEQGII